MKKRTQTILLLMIMLISLPVFYFLGGSNHAVSWLFNILYLLFIHFSCRLHNQKISQKLDQMWHLAQEKNVTIQELSKLSNLGTIDLEATKANQRTYIPSSKEINKIIVHLEQMA